MSEFTKQTLAYRQFRPHYPKELFYFIKEHCKTRKLAWEVGCGSGQATQDLAQIFDEVVAIDSSFEQIEMAPNINNVSYIVRSANDSSLDDQSVDAIVSAQALHWFNSKDFFLECQRVARSGALAVFWGYGIHHSGQQKIDQVLDHLAQETLAPFWRPEAKSMWSFYARLKFPFVSELRPPTLNLESDWNLEELMGYLSSWSGWAAYERSKKQSPREEIEKELTMAWGEPNQKYKFSTPLLIRSGFL